jgi:hypothetical protein
LANKDVAVPVVFPDYLIMVETPAVTVDVPDWIPGVPNEVVVPKTQNRVPYLGHAGILFFKGATGVTKYYEYGRYDPKALGLVRKQSIPDLRMASDGRPTAASLKAVLAKIARVSGQNGKIKGAYIELAPGAFERMLKYATALMAKNSDPKRTPYALLTNSCLHFVRDTAKAGGAGMPMVVDPRPSGYLSSVRAFFPDLDFTPPATLAIQGITLK